MQIFNNLKQRLEEFSSLREDEVYIYSCGPTVYDYSHVGHARSALVWDMLSRYLKFKGYKVKWIRNITNVDDKIVNRSKEEAVSPDQLSREFTHEFWKDMQALNVSWPEYEPRATDFISEMIKFIEALIEKGAAYEVNGDVYFRVNKHKNYGQLKGQSIEELQDGLSRIEENSRKESPLDFALWKAFPESPETSFLSPWGFGRPGWHLECSTMIKKILHDNNAGDTLDIHAGGDDLIFPHHENEAAQSEVLNEKALAKYWMHNGMVMINGSKMSKSENNFFTIRDLLTKFKANTIRYFCFSTHYKKQINFTLEALEAAEAGFDKLLDYLEPRIKELEENSVSLSSLDKDTELIKTFTETMDHDLNTAKALALLFENKEKRDTVIYLLEILGFDLSLSSIEKGKLGRKSKNILDTAMNILIKLREKARKEKNFELSDQIRDELARAKIKINDYRDKESTWDLE
jgi:cysteinyl-tRNA synthetase